MLLYPIWYMHTVKKLAMSQQGINHPFPLMAAFKRAISVA